ncbi:MAG: hypothetical protein J0L55_13945 [Caulobacterales bacterium]|nr:hypothetical protein [Caulobacterales bacterium]
MILAKIFYGLVVIGSVLSLMDYFGSISSASGAPQQAAGAAMALVLPVSLYVIARAVEVIFSKKVVAHSKSDNVIAE